jgi:fibronectin-binding autotransporter adhesin
MNKNNYRLVWSQARGSWVVAHENAHTCGKPGGSVQRSLAACLMMASLGLASALSAQVALATPPAPTALPQGGVVAAGSATITSPTASQLTITQATQQAVINWNRFDIGAQGNVNFIQPNTSASVLNRVLASDPTQIFGQLSANGRVYIINPNGIVFGAGSRVDAGALVASTLTITDADFMAGNDRFTRNGASGSIVNHGSLNAAPGGYVALLGASVTNAGSISTPNGNVILAAGDAVRLPMSGSGLITMAIDPASVNAAVANTKDGVISAPGGQIYLSATAASGLMAQAFNQGQIAASGGNVTLSAAQTDGLGETRQQGLVTVNNDQGAGGIVKLLGDRVGLFALSTTLATGASGGTVLVGGNVQGQGPELNARAVYMDKAAVIDASATQGSIGGNGGKVVLWSQDYTGFYGKIAARGASAGGNGGFVETSSHNNLQAFGHVNAAAPKGQAGNWLLDPTDVTIVTGAVNSNDTNTAGVWTPTTNTAQIGVANINTDLNAGTSVMINTASGGAGTGNVVQNAGATISKTAGGNATLTMNAAGGITLNDNISATVGSLAVNLNAAGGGINGTGNIALNGGLLTVNAAGSGTLSGVVSGSGGLTKAGIGTTILTGANTYTGTTNINAGTLAFSGSGTTPSTNSIIVNNTGTLRFDRNDTWGNAGTVTSAAITVNAGGTLASNNTFNTLWNLTLNSGTVLLNGGINATYPTFQLGGTLTATGTSTVTAGSGFFNSIVLGGNSLGALTIATPGSSDSLSIAVPLETNFINNSALIKSGAGTVTLSGANSYSGTTTVSAGALQIGSGGTTGTLGTGAVTNNATLAFNRADFSGVSNVISGTGAVADFGTGQLDIYGLNTYSGGTSVSNGGYLIARNPNALGIGIVTVNANSGFGLWWNTGSSTFANAIVLNSAGVTGNTAGNSNKSAIYADGGGGYSTFNLSGQITLNNAASSLGGFNGTNNLNLTGKITGTGGLSINQSASGASAVVTLSNTTNDFTGAVAVGQYLKMGATNALPSTSDVTVASGGTFDLAGYATTIGSLAGAGAVTSSVAGPVTLTTGGSNASTTFSGILQNGSGAVALTKTGTGTLTLSGANTYTGATIVSAGTLKAGSTTAFGSNSDATVTGTLDLAGFANTLGSLAGAGTVASSVVGAVTLTTGGSNASTTFSGVLQNGSGTVALTKVGSGTQTLTGTNTYSGTTTVSAGTLQIGSGGTTGMLGTGAVTNNATLGFNRSDAYTISNTISGTGTMTATSGSTLTIGGPVNLTGDITLTAGNTSAVSPTSVANGSVTGGDVVLNAAVNAAGAGKTVAIYSGNATTALYTSQVGGRAASLNKAYATSPGAGLIDTTKKLNAFFRVSPTVTVTGTASNKVYDATTAATVSSAGATFSGLIDGDSMTSTGLTGSFANANVGTAKAVTVTGGNLASNTNGVTVNGYQVINAPLTANITPAALTITANANSKTYDATTSALAAPTTSGLLGSDTVTGLSEAYVNKNVGTGKTLNVNSGYTVNDGNSGGNYMINLVNSTSGVITPAALTITATTNSKTYDATSSAAATPTASGLLGTDTVTGLSEAYTNKDVGSSKTLTVNNAFTVNDGNNGGNYTVNLVDVSAGVIVPGTQPNIVSAILRERIDVVIPVNGLVNESNIWFDQNLHQLFPEIDVILSVTGPEGNALPNGVNYIAESGELRFNTSIALPQYLLLTGLDRNKRLRRISVRLPLKQVALDDMF